jgi:hypothetical protein
VSLVFVARLTNGRPCSRFRTKPAAAIEPCGQTSFIGSAILRGTSSTRANAAHPEARRTGLAHGSCCATVFVASAIPHLTSMLDRRCFTWTRLRSMDRPSVVACHASTLSESDSHTPNPLFLVSPMRVNKKQPFRRTFDEKNAHMMQCDASMSQKTAATAMPRRFVQRQRIAQPRLSIGTNGTFSGPV